jgi:hypothetical protein
MGRAYETPIGARLGKGMCPARNKWSYATEDAAKEALRELQSKRKPRYKRMEKFVYPCAICDGWHTSHEDKPTRLT